MRGEGSGCQDEQKIQRRVREKQHLESPGKVRDSHWLWTPNQSESRFTQGLATLSYHPHF